MAGVCNICAICGTDIYDEQTIELLCSTCETPQNLTIPHSERKRLSDANRNANLVGKALKDGKPLVIDISFDSVGLGKNIASQIKERIASAVNEGATSTLEETSSVFESENTLEVYAKNMAERANAEASYRKLLAQLTHKELLEYAVRLLDGQEMYEIKYTMPCAEKRVKEIIQNRVGGQKSPK